MNRIDSSYLMERVSSLAGSQGWDHAGKVGAERAVAKDAASILADAKEEITMHQQFSSKLERKRLSQRSLRGAGVSQALRSEEIRAFLASTRRFSDPKAMADLVKLMQSSQRPGDVAYGASQNPAQRYMLLQLALTTARDENLPPPVSERIQDALDTLELQLGSEIRAGLNSIAAAADYATTPAGIEAFQATYGDMVLGQQSLAKTLLMVLNRLAGKDGEDLPKAMRTLMNALGADIASTRPSTDPVRLRALLQDVFRFEVVFSMLEECGNLAEVMAGRYGVGGIAAMELMKELVAFSDERWAAPHRFRALAERFRIAQLLARIRFFSATKAIMQTLPVQVFVDEDARTGLLGGMQSVIDQAVAEEEEQAERDERDQRQGEAS